MIDLIVLSRVDGTMQNGAAIGHNVRAVLDVVVEDRLEGLSRDALNMVGAHIAVPLDHRDYCLLAIRRGGVILRALSRRDGRGKALSGLGRPPTTDVRLIDFHNPCQLSRQRILGRGVSQPVNHEPCRFIRHSQHPMNLVGAHAFLAGAEQVDRHQPDVQWDVAVFKDSALRDRELLPAALALPHSRTNRRLGISLRLEAVGLSNHSAEGADRPPWPALLLEEVAGQIGVRKLLRNRFEVHSRISLKQLCS